MMLTDSVLGYYRIVIFYYIVGGLTFLPLCAVLLVSWFYLTAPIYRPNQSRVSQFTSTESFGDVEFSEERKHEALDLAVSNAEAIRQAELDKDKEEAVGTSSAPPSATRLKPLPPAAPAARPHLSGWLVVRRQFESDAVVAGLSQSRQEAASSSSGGARDDAGKSQGLQGADGEKGPGYMSSLYRGMLSYRNNKAAELERQKGAEGATGSGTSTPDSSQDERKAEKFTSINTKTHKQVAGTGNRESFHCILKASVLYLYSSDDTNNSTTECHAAIDLRKKRVSMFVSGLGDVEGEPNEFNYDDEPSGPFDTEESAASEGETKIETGPRRKKRDRRIGVRDGELFTKRNAIRIVSTAGTNTTDKNRRYAQWFVFCRSATVLEDWYHAILHASMLPESGSTDVVDPIGPVFSPLDMVSLLTSLDTLPDPIPLRWLNALVGRIFFSVYRTSWLEDYVTRKIMKKISRVKTPGFLSDIRVQEVDLGRSPPAFSRPMLKSLTGTGEASMEVAVHYTGCIRLTISTILTISLGSRFKPYNVPLVLAVIVNSLEGNLLLQIKPPPSNRIWFGFTKLPKMDISVEPVVSERKVQWSMVKKLIESRIRELLTESLVVPNMDDIPFFDSRPFTNRGGIWSDASKRPDESTSTAAEVASKGETVLEEKSKNSPASVLNMSMGGEEGKSTATEVESGQSSDIKRRHPLFGESLVATPTSSSSSMSTSPAAAGLSTLLAREKARTHPPAEAADETAKLALPSQSSSKRLSWFVGRTNSPASVTVGGSNKRSMQQQSSLAWGNASLTRPDSSEATVASQSAPVSSIELPMQDTHLSSNKAGNNHEKKTSVSSFATDNGSVASADTEELHSSLMAALGDQAEKGLGSKKMVNDVPSVIVQGSTDSQMTEQEMAEDAREEHLHVPVSLSSEQRSLEGESLGADSKNSTTTVLPPPTAARRSPTHGFAPPPSRGATVRKQQETPQTGIKDQYSSNASVGLSNRQRDRYGLSPRPADDDDVSLHSSKSSTATLINTWGKAKASMADKDSRQAAAREAKDALKRGWASWNAKKNPSLAGMDDLPISSDRLGVSSENSRGQSSTWLASSPPDPVSLGIGFDVNGEQLSPVQSIVENSNGNTIETVRPSFREEESNSSRASSLSGRTAYREHRASKEKDSTRGVSASREGTPPTLSAIWDSAVPSVTPPLPAAKKENNSTIPISTSTQHQPPLNRSSSTLSSSPSSIRKMSNAPVPDSATSSTYSFIPTQGQTTTSLSRSEFAAELEGQIDSKEETVLSTSSSMNDAVVSLELPNSPESVEMSRKVSSGSTTSDTAAKTVSPSARHASPESNLKGIKQQPTRAAMMAIPGIPSMQRTNPQSFSAAPVVPPKEVFANNNNSPRLALGTFMSRMPSFGATNATPMPSLTASSSVIPALPSEKEEQATKEVITDGTTLTSQDVGNTGQEPIEKQNDDEQVELSTKED